MRALWLDDRRLRLREDAPRPVPPSGEALVRVLAAGICNTDIEMTRGYYPFTGIPGHEFVGVVEEGPSGLTGRRVAGEINAVCHECEPCRNGRSTHCDRRTVLGIIGRNGSMAEYLSLPAENLHVVPDEVPSECALFTEPLAAALEIQEQVRIDRDARVLVVGDGKLAQLVARTLALTGCALAVTGRHREKLALLESVGILTVAAEKIEHRSFDIAVECSGAASGFALARRALRARGTLVMKSTYAGELTVNASSMVVDELTLIGSRCGPFAPALRLLASGTIDPRPLIHGRYRLSDGLAAFEHAQKPGVLKVIVEM
ncbi:MAG: MDR/zinc-dependent alcohol dehydrogenase-like family protein [Thermoanaerobaculia bacterium]